MDLGKNEKLTYGQGGILNHWENDGFATYGASPIGYPSGNKWNGTSNIHHIDKF